MRRCVATVGTFDGVHLGHRAIIARMGELAREKGLYALTVTFVNHPLTVIAPERAPLWAQSRKVSEGALRSEKTDIAELDFTAELAAMTAGEFMEWLRDRYGVNTLVMGYDNTFGSDRLSTREQYEEAGRRAGLNVEFVEALTTADGRPVSSSRLRRAIAAGDLGEATMLLGSAPVYTARVAKGRQLGRKIGIPTMNLEIEEGLVELPDGVYAARYMDAGRELPAVLSIGTNPTIADGNLRTHELHVPDCDLGNMYGREVSFAVVEKLRDIERFDSLESLREAIRGDIEKSKELFTAYKSHL